MLTRTSLARLLAVLAILMIPAAAFAGAGDGCWLRDGVAPSATRVYALCQQGEIYISSDAGANWQMMQTGSENFLRAIAFTDLNHGIVVGDKGAVLTSDDAGKTWQVRDPQTKENLLAVTSIGNDVWASGFDGVLVHSSDGGRTWTKQVSTTTLALEDIFFLDKNRGFAVGWSGTILRTTDGGQKWSQMASKAQWSLTAMHFKDANNGYIVGFSGQLLRTKDAGETWQLLPAPTNAWLKDVAVDSQNRIWIASDDRFLMSTDDGATFKPVAVSTQAFLKKFMPVGGNLWALGQLALMRQQGADWKVVDSLKVLSKSDAKAQLARQDINAQTQQNTAAKQSAPSTKTAPKK